MRLKGKYDLDVCAQTLKVSLDEAETLLEHYGVLPDANGNYVAQTVYELKQLLDWRSRHEKNREESQ